MVYDTVIFDLDGTLLNTLMDLKDSLNYVLGKNGFPAVSYTHLLNSPCPWSEEKWKIRVF